ncbi:endonuclease domain-containing protein [Fibrobacterota bacterium]
MVNLAREKRKKPTPGERALWFALKRKKGFGCHFRRQAPFGRYILDFYCTKKRLAIEVDGDSHIGNEENDRLRQEDLNSWHVHVIRFKEEDVLKNIKQVLAEIETAVNQIKDLPHDWAKSLDPPGSVQSPDK